MRNVYYAPKMEGYSDTFNHPLFEDEVFIPIQPYLKYYKENHSKHTYWECPAWKKYYKNVYVIFSQVDFEISYEKNTGVISPQSYDHCVFDEGRSSNNFDGPPEFFGRTDNSLPYHGLAIGQLKQHYIFWTDHRKKDDWIEVLDSPSIDAELIRGEFPFSRWFRPTLFAYKFTSEVTTVKRGDPIGLIKFKNESNMLLDYSLERKKVPDDVYRKSITHPRLKMFLPKVSWDLIKSPTKQESKCPFKKFF